MIFVKTATNACADAKDANTHRYLYASKCKHIYCMWWNIIQQTVTVLACIFIYSYEDLMIPNIKVT